MAVYGEDRTHLDLKPKASKKHPDLLRQTAGEDGDAFQLFEERTSISLILRMRKEETEQEMKNFCQQVVNKTVDVSTLPPNKQGIELKKGIRFLVQEAYIDKRGNVCGTGLLIDSY